MTVLARPTDGTCRPSCRSPGEPHSNGPSSHRLDANSRGPFVAIVSADQAAASLRLPSQTPPKEGSVETTPTPSVCHDWCLCAAVPVGLPALTVSVRLSRRGTGFRLSNPPARPLGVDGLLFAGRRNLWRVAGGRAFGRLA